jgi:hypothetical protein
MSDREPDTERAPAPAVAPLRLEEEAFDHTCLVDLLSAVDGKAYELALEQAEAARGLPRLIYAIGVASRSMWRR